MSAAIEDKLDRLHRETQDVFDLIVEGGRERKLHPCVASYLSGAIGNLSEARRYADQDHDQKVTER